MRAAGPAEQLVPFVIIERGVARPGDAVVGGGVVTSGTFSPSLEVGIGMAYLPVGARARPGPSSRSTCAARTVARRVETRPLLKV